MNDHPMLDDIALYALGVLPAKRAAGDDPNAVCAETVRAHLATCAICRKEYADLGPAANLIGLAAEAPADDAARDRLKARIMAQVRRESVVPLRRPERRGGTTRSVVWPAYLVAAACFVFALISTISNLALVGQLRDVKTQLAQTQAHSSSLARNLADERTTLADVMDANAKHYAITDGEVITRGRRIYVALHDLPEPPRGHVYQAWTLPKDAKAMKPSVTFVPDARGVAVIALPVDAHTTDAVAVSVEPDGGSKAPTTKPLFVVPLS